MINEILYISGISVYDAPGDEKFYTASAGQIKTRESFGDDSDIVILCTKNSQNVSAIVIRK